MFFIAFEFLALIDRDLARAESIRMVMNVVMSFGRIDIDVNLFVCIVRLMYEYCNECIMTVPCYYVGRVVRMMLNKMMSWFR